MMKGIVHRYERDAWIRFQDLPVDTVCAWVIPVFFQRPEDRLALRRDLKFYLFQDIYRFHIL